VPICEKPIGVGPVLAMESMDDDVRLEIGWRMDLVPETSQEHKGTDHLEVIFYI